MGVDRVSCIWAAWGQAVGSASGYWPGVQRRSGACRGTGGFPFPRPLDTVRGLFFRCWLMLGGSVGGRDKVGRIPGNLLCYGKATPRPPGFNLVLC